MPSDVAAASRVHAGALRAGLIVVLAPKVVVEDVAAGCRGSPLDTEVRAADQFYVGRLAALLRLVSLRGRAGRGVRKGFMVLGLVDNS